MAVLKGSISTELGGQYPPELGVSLLRILQQTDRDPELFKKLKDDIWEFRTLYQGLQYRLLAFWDKTENKETLVVSTHGFVKKRSKIPDSEQLKAKHIRTKYFEDKPKIKIIKK